MHVSAPPIKKVLIWHDEIGHHQDENYRRNFQSLFIKILHSFVSRQTKLIFFCHFFNVFQCLKRLKKSHFRSSSLNLPGFILRDKFIRGVWKSLFIFTKIILFISSFTGNERSWRPSTRLRKRWVLFNSSVLVFFWARWFVFLYCQMLHIMKLCLF